MQIFNSCRAATAALHVSVLQNDFVRSLSHALSHSLLFTLSHTLNLSFCAMHNTHIPRAHPMLASSGSCAPLFHLSFAFQFSLRADVFDCWLR